MVGNVYEGMFILDANRYARDPGGVPRQIDDAIKKFGGEVLVSRMWTEQKLAYAIKGQSKGTYWLVYFRLDSSRLAELNHQAKLNDNVLRSLILKIDPRLVDTMVAHASGTSSAAATESPDKKASVEKDEGAEKDSADEVPAATDKVPG